MNVRLLYNNTQWIESGEIKSANVIKEIDITNISAPTTTVDIVLRCEQFDDLNFILYKSCDLYINDDLLFNLYISESSRNGDYEWRLSLTGLLGYGAQINYYGDVYSPSDDFLDKPYYLSDAIFNPNYSYTPTISTIKGIFDDIKEKTGIDIEFDDSFSEAVNTTLHKVGLLASQVDLSVLYIAFLLGSYINDEHNVLKLIPRPNTVKEIPEEVILNDTRITYNELYDVNVITYKYECLRHGTYIDTSMADVVGSSTNNGYVVVEQGAYWCGQENIISLPSKSEEDDIEAVFSAPVSSIGVWVSQTGWSYTQGVAPTNPNYSPKGEACYNNGVKYDIIEENHRIKIENSVVGNEIKIEDNLLSSEWYETIKDRVKQDFSYVYKVLLKIVERPDNLAKYGTAKYGTTKYGVNIGDTTYDIGDKVKFNIRGKHFEGYITKMTYKLNGNIKIKDCEVTCNRSDE